MSIAPLPLETAFDFLNTLELENGALVERLTSLDVAAAWLAEHGVIHDPRQITVLARRQSGTDAALQRLVRTRSALRDVAHAVAHEDRPLGVGHRGGQPGARRPRADRARGLVRTGS